MKIADIAKIIEAVLFVSGDGVDRDEFKRIYDLSDKELNKCLDILKEKYNEASGINIINYKNKIQLCSNPALADNVAEILNPIRERSLTKAALETVAIVAYKQPITRTEIEQIRGVNCDYAVQLLQSNNLIQVVGRKDAVGKPLLFGTTDDFLKRFELTSLDELPNHKELLDRIRVIHSEGDSLYREFSIPDETDENAETTENSNEVTSSPETAENINENTENTPQNSETTTEGVEQGVEPKIVKKKTTKKSKTSEVVETEKAVEDMTSSKIAKAESVADVEVENPIKNVAKEESESVKPVESVAKTEPKKADGFSIDNFEMPVKTSGRRKNLIESLQDMPKGNNQEDTASVKKSKGGFKNMISTSIEEAKTSEVASEVSAEPVKLSWKEKLKIRLAEQAKEEK